MGSVPRASGADVAAPLEHPDPEDGAAELGRKIRELRSKAGLTAREVAVAAGVSRSLVSQIERGTASPSVTTLRRIAAALGVPVAQLFLGTGEASSGETDRYGRRLVVRRGERKGLHLPGADVVYELLTPDLNRRVEFIWIEYPPGDATPAEPMSHPGEENALCLEGEVVVVIDGEEFVLGEGDSISFDSGIPHRVENRGATRATLVSAITPPAF